MVNLQNPTALPRRGFTTWGAFGLIAVWLAALVAGWCWMNHYEFGTNAPSTQGAVMRWPDGSALTPAGDRPTLLFFLHPKCPCSRANLAELERLLMSVKGVAPIAHELIVVATVPTDANDEWFDTDTVRRGGTYDDTRLFVDRGGIEAARFGVTTSGHVMLFDQKGLRQYTGGITISRAHEGDNVGRQCVEELLLSGTSDGGQIPAFGCRLCLPQPSLGNGAQEVSPTVRRAVKPVVTPNRPT